MIGYRCLDLVGRADEHFGPLELLVHADDFRTTIVRLFSFELWLLLCRGIFTGRFHCVAYDFLLDFFRAHLKTFRNNLLLMHQINWRRYVFRHHIQSLHRLSDQSPIHLRA